MNSGLKKTILAGITILIITSLIAVSMDGPVLVQYNDPTYYRIGFDARIAEDYENDMVLDVYNETDLVESILTWRSAYQEETENYQYYNMFNGHWNISTILTFRYVWRNNVTEEILFNTTFSGWDWTDRHGNYYFNFQVGSTLFVTEWYPEY